MCWEPFCPFELVLLLYKTRVIRQRDCQQSSPPGIDPAISLWIVSAPQYGPGILLERGNQQENSSSPDLERLSREVFFSSLESISGSGNWYTWISKASDWSEVRAVGTPIRNFPKSVGPPYILPHLSQDNFLQLPSGLAARSSPKRVLGTMIQAPQWTSLPYPISSFLPAPGIFDSWLGYKRSPH